MILNVKNLSVSHKSHEIIKNINFSLKNNSCLGILGESGSGKSITCKAIMGLLDESFKIEGEVYYKGEKLSFPNKLAGKDICMVIQNPMTAFNPLFTIENQVIETLSTHKNMEKVEALELVLESFEKMNLQNGYKILKKYPHELSGGMLQRIMIALTISLKPSIIIADEPTTAIDVVSQVEVIKELKKIRELLETSIIFISHDLSILSKISDEIMVMHRGNIIEKGLTRDIISRPQENQTRELINTRFKLINKFKELVEV